MPSLALAPGRFGAVRGQPAGLVRSAGDRRAVPVPLQPAPALVLLHGLRPCSHAALPAGKSTSLCHAPLTGAVSVQSQI